MARAEIHCLNCGRFLGEVERDAQERLHYIPPERRGGPFALLRRVDRRFTCGRCGGRAFIEGFDLTPRWNRPQAVPVRVR